MTLIGFAESSHPELEQPDVVLLARPRGTQEGQNLLGVLPPSPVHFGELEQHLDLTKGERLSCERAPVGKMAIYYLNPGFLFIQNNWILLTSSTLPSDTTGSEIRHPQTSSHWTGPPQACLIEWDLEKNDKTFV